MLRSPMHTDATQEAEAETDGLGRSDGVYVFGRFRLDPVRRRLLQDGAPVMLSARLFEALAHLVAHHDRVVSRDELEATVWPSRTMERSNIGQAIYALRKTLEQGSGGERFLLTVAGRGYQFAAPVSFERWAPPEAASAVSTPVALVADPRPETAAVPRRGVGRVRAAFAAAVCLLLLAGAALAVRLSGFAAATAGTEETGPAAPSLPPPPRSLAVLPFDDRSGPARDGYFADGISEELIAALGRLPALRVAAPSSSFALRNRSSREIGKRLNVRLALEGSLRRGADRLRVTATLTDTGTGFVVWAQNFDFGQRDAFLLPEQIAAAVAASVQGALLREEDAARLRIGGTDDPRALDAYLRGMKLRNQRSDDAIRRARAAFAEARAIDPKFVLAEVEEADLFILGAEGYGAKSPDPAAVRRWQTRALDEAKDAVAKAPELGEAHAVLASAQAEFWQFAEQRAELARAEVLAPSNPQILLAYARAEVDSGQADAAVDAATRAAALDPLAPDVYADLAGVLMLARRPAAALVTLQHAAELGFDGAPYSDLVARAKLMQGDYAEAWRRCAPGEDWFQLVCAAMAGGPLGRAAEADAALARLHAVFGDNAAYQFARIDAFRGNAQSALRWLAVAYRQRDDGLIDIEADQFLDPLRGFAPFRDLVRALGVGAGTEGSSRNNCSPRAAESC